MHISNRFAIVCNIQIVIQMLKILITVSQCYKFEYGGYLIVKLTDL